MILTKIHKFLFYLLILLLPLNLGKHYEIVDSYVSGLLVDYLIPTVYVQDLLIIGILVFWAVKLLQALTLKKTYFCNFLAFLTRREIQVSIIFLFAVFLSTLMSSTVTASMFLWGRLVLYVLLFWYLSCEFDFKKDFKLVLTLLSFGVVVLSLISFAQFVKQGSVFNNYLILGEQPYNNSLRFIVRERVLGRIVVPPYGLFKHPNIFGGFLSIVLIWLFYQIKREFSVSGFKEGIKNRWQVCLNPEAFLLGLGSLILTFSVFSWVAFGAGLFFVLKQKSGKQPMREAQQVPKTFSVGVATIILVAVLSLFLPLFSRFLSTESHPSYYKRADLIQASYQMIKTEYPFGIGYGSSTNLISKYLPKSIQYLRFYQPVHNIFLVLLLEAGMFSLILFVYLLYLGYKLTARHHVVFSISILQIVILGSFDHYFLTIHQTLLLLWMVLGISYSFSKKKA